MTRPDRHGEAGLTLIELMIAVVVSTIIVAFLLGIHTRMSVAYRSQAGVSSVLQTLRAGRQYLQRDLRMAGFMVPAPTISVSTALDASGTWPVLSVINDADGTGPDRFRVLYANPDVSATITAMDLTNHSVTVSDPSVFADDEPIMLIAASGACLAAVTSRVGNQLFVDPSSANAFNQAPNNAHCDAVAAQVADGVIGSAHGLVMAAYRIDPERRAAAVLQRSASGGAVDDWEDLGVGFTNIQIASRFFQPGDTTDHDGDGDPERDWYSGENQETPDPTGTRPPGTITDLSLSLEVCSDASVRTVGSPATPAFIDLAHAQNNRLGDWGQACPGNTGADPCGIDLQATADSARPERYRGVHIYRWSTTLVDLRNIGVGL